MPNDNRLRDSWQQLYLIVAAIISHYWFKSYRLTVKSLTPCQKATSNKVAVISARKCCSWLHKWPHFLPVFFVQFHLWFRKPMIVQTSQQEEQYTLFSARLLAFAFYMNRKGKRKNWAELRVDCAEPVWPPFEPRTYVRTSSSRLRSVPSTAECRSNPGEELWHQPHRDIRFLRRFTIFIVWWWWW